MKIFSPLWVGEERHGYLMAVSLKMVGWLVGLVTKSYPTLATPRTVACQAPRPLAFSRQEHWNGLPFPSPKDLPDPGIEPGSPALQADALLTEL